jgi:CHAT domain-containing protein
MTGSQVVEVQFLMPPTLEDASQEESTRSEKTLSAAGLRPQVVEKAESSIRRLFAAAAWEFHADGVFRFTPSPEVDIREDLYPLTGHYSRRQGMVEFRAQRESPLGASVSVDGLIRETQTGGRLEAVYVVSSGLSTRVASVRQDLGPPLAAVGPSTEVGGVPVPSAFEVSLSARMDGKELPGAAPIPAPRPAWEFEVILNGKTEAGSFENLAGLLILFPKGQSGYEMGLTTSGEARNGWLRWSGSIEGDALAKGEPVTTSLEPQESDPKSQSAAGWFTISSEPGFQGMSVNVAPKKISLRLTIREGKTVEGEIRGEGLALAQSLMPSTYHATLRGKVRVSPEEERLRKESSQVDFAGDFEVEDGSGGPRGSLSMAHECNGLSGTFVTEGRALHLRGEQDGSRVDFTEPGHPGSSLLLRAVAHGESLVGLWRKPGQDTLLPLVARARRAAGAAVPTADGTAGDADALRYLAIDLVRAGRCQAGREPLDKALVIYQREGERAGDGVKMDSILISEYAAAQLVVDCDLSLEDYTRFVKDLQRALTFLRALGSTENGLRAGRDQAGTLRERLISTASQVQAFADRIHALSEKLGARVSGSSAPPSSADAVGACWSELEAFRRLLEEEAREVDSLAAELAGGKRSAGQALTTMAERRADLQGRARSTIDRLAAIGREIAAREPGLLEERDRYWRLFAEANGTHGPGLEALEQEEERLRAAIKSSGQLGELEKEFVFQQAGAGIVLQAFEQLLKIDTQGLAKLPAEAYVAHLGAQAVQAAVALAERPEVWRRWLLSDGDKGKALDRLQSFFGQLILFLIEVGQKGDALTVAETARSRALVDLLAGRPEVEAAIKAVPVAANGRVLPSPTAAAPLPLVELLDVVRRRGSTTLEYFLTDEKLVILVVSPTGGIEAIAVPFEGQFSRKDLAQSIRELKDLLSPPPGTVRAPTGGDEKRTARLLRQLYALLIAPIPARLLPPAPEEALTIIPYGELFSVPFAALQDEEGRSLIEHHALVYGTSIAVLKYARLDREQLPVEREQHLLAFVNPSPMPLGDDREPLPPLEKVAAGFMNDVASLFPESSRHVLTGAAANKAALFEDAEKATEMYLVTHAKTFAGKRALDSYIALAAGSTPEDGYLRVPDVFLLHLKADLVILWACETGGGDESADGVQGLSRAFTWAGAPSLMLSLWEIPEFDSLQQMAGFHQLWRKEGRSKAQALRLAQLGQMALYPDQPGVWAAFVLYGEGN